MAYIYQIINQLNGKMYIGKTEYNPPERRWKQHVNESHKTRNRHRALYGAMHKYGEDNFSFIVLEETNNPNEREQYYIQKFDTYHNGYNETLGGDGSAYLELPEQEICQFYVEGTHSLKDTAEHFGHDILTIKRILYKYNIPIVPSHIVSFEKRKRAVAKLDPNTQEILEVFSCVKDAEAKCPTGKHIGQVCTGKRKTAGGYAWKYID